jgi:KaiC/GvpD/RAD55 family RecA-like ATPase
MMDELKDVETSESVNGKEKLPGNEMSQAALLGHLLTDAQFFSQAVNRIQPDWWKNPYHSKLYALLQGFYKATTLFPTYQEFITQKGFDGLDPLEKKALDAALAKCLLVKDTIRLATLKTELTMWLHSKILHDQILKATKAWNTGRFDLAAGYLGAAAEAYKNTRFNDGEAVRFADAGIWLKKTDTDKTNTLTTGLALLDRGLLSLSDKDKKDRDLAAAKKVAPEPIPGGLQLRDTTVILAPSNAGKTTTLITIARHNVSAARSVLFMTHEGAPEDIRLKMLMAMMGKTRGEILEMYKDPVALRKIEESAKLLDEGLVYVPFNKAGMKVEDVVPVIRRYQEERASKNGGKGFDLLVSDYPAKLTTEMASKGNMSTRHIQEIVYENYVQLALEYGFHSLLAIQTNREASRVNSGQYDGKDSEHRLLTMEDVAESWGPMTSASNVITLNRSPTAQAMNRITYYVAKCRSSKTGLAVVANSKFDCSLSHSNEMGATAYYGTKTMESTIDTALRSFRDQVIPDDVVFASKD